MWCIIFRSASLIRSVVLLVSLLPGVAVAAELTVRDAWSRATPGGGPGAGYLTIHGGDAADRLIGASSARAGAVTLHTMLMDGSVMRMRALDGVDVPAGGTVVLAPNTGLHLMLERLTAPLRAGEAVPLVLRFEHAGELRIDAVVGGAGATMPP